MASARVDGTTVLHRVPNAAKYAPGKDHLRKHPARTIFRDRAGFPARPPPASSSTTKVV